MYLRVLDYNGDFDTLSDVLLIGPYDTAHQRSEDAARLLALEEGGMEIQTTDLTDGDYTVTPDAIAHVATEDELFETIYRSR